VCLLAGLADRGIAGHSAGRPRDASLVLGAFATLDFPLTDVQVFHTDRGSEFDNTRIDEPLDVFDIKKSLSRKGNLVSRDFTAPAPNVKWLTDTTRDQGP